jgi:hypothetical protein
MKPALLNFIHRDIQKVKVALKGNLVGLLSDSMARANNGRSQMESTLVIFVPEAGIDTIISQ